MIRKHLAKTGKFMVIAAGSVGTKDITSNVLAGGVPCRVIRKLDK